MSMLTPQEITDKVFVKAVFGGYDMTGVDEFLEAVCADYTALYKENAILKGKLKVLVEKVEEYRSTEDAMRMALLTAQRMGEEITSEANKQKEETLRSAEMEIKAKFAENAKKIADEELRLDAAAKETAKFIELSQAIMRKHSEFLTKLETARRAVRPDSASDPAPVQTPQPVQQPIQQPVQQQVQQPAPQIIQQPIQQPPPQPAQQPIQQPAPQQTREEQIADAAEMIGNVMEKLTGGSPSYGSAVQHEPPPAPSIEDADEPTKLYIPKSEDPDASVTPRPKFDFDDLKFGSNFDPNE